MRFYLGFLLAISMASAALSGPVSFSTGWSEQRLKLFSSNDYTFGTNLGIRSDGSVSLAWTRLPRSEWGARTASWNWTVEQSVPPTDLSLKGGDDRNISLYFVFLPEDEAETSERAGIRSLLGNDQVRVLQYVWGGNHARGQVIASPYGPAGQGATVALRQASTGTYSEDVDLARDYATAFGGAPGALVGLAVSADSDDTNSNIRAALGGLVLR
ncbi:DUF3047 domain-containing protein [Yoonia sp.]|uniref:DUF3047 domain-containing protein n=1 Tax=Yoonia sp. TaxID=2212373 RepID=UPI0019E1ABFF|nr:DUF3047 domain-containing protein [Yoonia sp.]MBE0414381.1 DUF3047 domain-containing protein [Yoonia sp.]